MIKSDRCLLGHAAVRRSSGRAVKRALRRMVDTKSTQDRPLAEHYAALIASSIKLSDTRIERTSSSSLGWLIAAAAANDSYLGGIALNQSTTERLLEVRTYLEVTVHNSSAARNRRTGLNVTSHPGN